MWAVLAALALAVLRRAGGKVAGWLRGATPKKEATGGHNGCDPPATMPGKGKVNGLVDGVNHKKRASTAGDIFGLGPSGKECASDAHPPLLPGILGKNRDPWGQLSGARSPQIREGRTGNALKFERVTYKDAKVNGMVNTIAPKKAACPPWGY